MEARRLVGTMTFPVVILVAWLWLAGGPFASVLPHAARDIHQSVHVAAVEDAQHVNIDSNLVESRDFLRMLLSRALPVIYPGERFVGIAQPNYAPDATTLLTSSP